MLLEKANDDLTCLDALSTLWDALAGARRRLVSLSAAVDSINARCVRTLGGYAGAKITFGRIPRQGDFQ